MSAKKGPQVGSGGQRRKALQGRGPTPPARERPGHPAERRAGAGTRHRPAGRSGGPGETSELVTGRNPVVEALRARVPATALQVAVGVAADPRLREALRMAGDRGIAVLEVPKVSLDRITAGGVHQGVALSVAPYDYVAAEDLLSRALDAAAVPLLVALDGVTDPRNLGAVVRSAAAFGAHGVVVPERRAAPVTATSWKASAGALARVPVARCTNLVRTLKAYATAGMLVVGLTADGEMDLSDLEAAVDPLVLVIGSEGRGLSRLVAETCDLTASISMAAGSESLNASVAAGVGLYEVARRRAAQGRL
jgi:23S rRNA (guanosine2251-2'-O)-methyltransferase